MSEQVSVKLLAGEELAAWRGFLEAHAALVGRLDAELEREHGLSLTAYEVLLHLAEAPERRLRMSELAGSLLLSQSGATRLVDRLERRGLVRRERCETDGRGLYAVLTGDGAALFVRARPTHLDGVRRLFLSRLSADELRSLALLWQRVVPA